MSEDVLLRFEGGPTAGDSLASLSAFGDVWPLPLYLELDEHKGEGFYEKVSESQLTTLFSEGNHLRGARYEWRPGAIPSPLEGPS